MLSNNRIIHGFILYCFFCLLIQSCGRSSNNYRGGKDILKSPFEMTLYDSDYSLAYSRIYTLEADSLHILFKSGIVGESDDVVYEGKLSEEEQKTIARFFNNFPIEKLESEYIKANVDDGDQKLFIFKIGTTEKKIHVSNYYKDEIADLVGLLNELVPIEYKIKYIRN